MPTKSILLGAEDTTQEGPTLCFASDMYDGAVKVIERAIVINGEYKEVQKEVSVTGADIEQLVLESLEKGGIFYICDLSGVKPISLQYVERNFAIAFSAIIIAKGEIYVVKTKGKRRSNMLYINFNHEEIVREEISDLIAYHASMGGGRK